MAFRIHDFVSRGEIDCRTRGRITGELWISGDEAPVTLDLSGIPCGDLAGCLFSFESTGEISPLPARITLDRAQKGAAGDVTASKKVRVLDIPVEDAMNKKYVGKQAPSHQANAIYLEWFSTSNGRVVLETTDFTSTITAPEWKFTPADEASRTESSEAAFENFMQTLADATDEARSKVPEDKDELDEFDYERLLRESDARTDHALEYFEKHGRLPGGHDLDNDESFEALQELSWQIDDGDTPEMTPDPATEGTDWIRGHDDEVFHPFLSRFDEVRDELLEVLKTETGWSLHDESPLTDIFTELHRVGAKTRSGLCLLPYHAGPDELNFSIAHLKRGLAYLHNTQSNVAANAEPNLLSENAAETLSAILLKFRDELLTLIDSLRIRAKE